jgi:exopolysaccharide biosynthesis polyprenyl glycosylphosphotransferase
MKRHSHVFLSLALAADALCVAVAWMVCYWLRFSFFSYVEPTPPSAFQFLLLLPYVVLCDLLALSLVGAYRVGRNLSPAEELMLVMRGAVVGWLAMLAVFYFERDIPYSRKLLAVFLVANPLALVGSRGLLRLLYRGLRARGVGIQRAAIIGAGRLGQAVCDRIRQEPWLGIRVEYFVDDTDEQRHREVRGLPVLGARADFLTVLTERPVDTVFLAVSAKRADCVDSILRELAKLPMTVTVVPDLRRASILNVSVGELGDMPAIHLRDTPIQGWSALAKRAIDIAGAAALLLLLGLPMLVVALLVKLTSPGPVLFRQERMGLGGRPFNILKFRSMRVDAEAGTGPVFAHEHDPRRTRFGVFLRRTSIDELPQLINVLRGDMSLIGPRPERPFFVQQFSRDLPSYMLRHNVKAGITGWAQVNGLRGQTSIRKRLQYDLYYINHWSLTFDIAILLLTPFSGVLHKHAH